jgi:hypothetical protein
MHIFQKISFIYNIMYHNCKIYTKFFMKTACKNRTRILIVPIIAYSKIQINHFDNRTLLNQRTFELKLLLT